MAEWMVSWMVSPKLIRLNGDLEEEMDLSSYETIDQKH